MKKNIFYLLILILLIQISYLSGESDARLFRSVHEEHLNLFPERHLPVQIEKRESLIKSEMSQKSNSLKRSVFGYLPYWERSTDAAFFRYDLLSHLAIFNWGVNPEGNLTQPPGWPGDWNAIIGEARNSGVKLIMCVTEFNADDMRSLITNQTHTLHFINNISSEIEFYNLNGINLDFEAPYNADKGAVMNSFVKQVSDSLHARFGAGCEVSFAGPAVNWGDNWDLTLTTGNAHPAPHSHPIAVF